MWNQKIEVSDTLYKCAPWIEFIGGLTVWLSCDNWMAIVGLIGAYTGGRALLLRMIKKPR